MTIESFQDATPGPCDICKATGPTKVHRFPWRGGYHRRRLCADCHGRLDTSTGHKAVTGIFLTKMRHLAEEIAKDKQGESEPNK